MPRYQCYAISMRNRDDSFDFGSETFDHALDVANMRLGKGDWKLVYDRETAEEKGMDGLWRTYKRDHWYIYIHHHSCLPV